MLRNCFPWKGKPGRNHVDYIGRRGPRAYVPTGTLPRAVTSPRDLEGIDGASIKKALIDMGLAGLVNGLDELDAWDRRLSEGEEQRLLLIHGFM